MERSPWVRWLEDLGNDDVDQVGGKNASLGEMIGNLRAQGVRVPGGFATTAAAYRSFLEENQLDGELAEIVERFERGKASLEKTGRAARKAIRGGEFPGDIARAIADGYAELSRRHETDEIAVAVRSSATAEDLPEASFAGQQETYLNIRGSAELLEACRDCYASLFTDRAISYRREKGFGHLDVALSVGVQVMVNTDRAGAGVMFSLDTDSGCPAVVVINASWGLGESVVSGMVNPDEYVVFKAGLGDSQLSPIIDKVIGAKERKVIFASGKHPTRTVDTPKKDRRRPVLDDDEILTLARWAVAIEDHYGVAMDIEWAKDGESDRLYCVQARPETVHARAPELVTYSLEETAETIVTGVAIGQAIATGKVAVLHSPDQMGRFEDGDILVTERTDPDWGPIMKRAAAIVTDHGGRTSHAAIVSRELGIPAVVGTGEGTELLEDGAEITVSCAEGSHGHVYPGALEFCERAIDLDEIGEPPVDIMINLATPDAAFRWWRLPVAGVGLARMEFIISDVIKVHPLALIRYDELDAKVRAEIDKLTRGYDDRTEYFVELLARGIARIAASRHPDPVIVRLSDFKTNEYANLIGGAAFEPHEENPMIGFRGASRYYSERYAGGFALECRAVLRAREVMGLDNIIVMIPFVRSTDEADRVIAALAENGLARGRKGLEIYMTCEVPANVFRAAELAERFDGFSIGSNDLTQLILGVDRDSEELAGLFSERDPAVKEAIRQVIEAAHAAGCPVGICGQAPSDDAELARFLVEAGIDSISVSPDSVFDVIEELTR